MKVTQCIPRLKGSNRPPSPISLLDRFREVVFRLIMLTAVSKAGRPHHDRPPAQPRTHHPDSHRSQAVEDCIEFFKKSSAVAADGEAKRSDAGDEAVGMRSACNGLV